MQDFITALFFMWMNQPKTKLVSSVLKCQRATTQDKLLTKWNENNLQSALSHHLLPTCCATTLAKQRFCCPPLIEPSQTFKTQSETWYLLTSCKLPQQDAAVCRKWNLAVSAYQGQGKGKSDTSRSHEIIHSLIASIHFYTCLCVGCRVAPSSLFQHQP